MNIQIVMVTTACKPIVDEVDGKLTQKSLTFKAGQKYTVEKTKEIERWLECNYCYIAGEPAPKTPPKYDAPIASSRTDNDESVLEKFVDMIADRLGGIAGKGMKPARA